MIRPRAVRPRPALDLDEAALLDAALSRLVAEGCPEEEAGCGDVGIMPASTRACSEGMPASARASKPASTRGSNPASARAEEEEVEEEEEKNAARARSLADRVLSIFNERAGTDYSLGDDCGRCVAERVADHPAITVEEFGRIIEAAFASPWWTGIPSPLVVFSRTQFAQARQALSGAADQLEQKRRKRDLLDAYIHKTQRSREWDAFVEVEDVVDGDAIEVDPEPVVDATDDKEERAADLLARYGETLS